MALIGINPVGARQRKPTVLEQIESGVNIAAKVLGGGLEVYKTGLEKDKQGLEFAKSFKTASPEEIEAGKSEKVQGHEGDFVHRSNSDPLLDAIKLQLLQGQLSGQGTNAKKDALAIKKMQFDLETANKPKLPAEAEKSANPLIEQKAKFENAANYLQNELQQFENPDVAEDVKVQIGRGMLKGLNSVLGADAVGAEEAKRLGNLLEFKKVNLFEPGSVVGRDLDLFAEQIRAKLRSIEGSARSTNEQLERIYKTYGITPPPSTIDQTKPRYTQDVLDYAKKHNISPDQALQIKADRLKAGQ